MRKYHYFIHYTFTDDTGTGNGCSEVISQKPIKDWDDIQRLIDIAKKEFKYDTVVISNYILMKVTKGE